jgi:hypothetical protein
MVCLFLLHKQVPPVREEIRILILPAASQNKYMTITIGVYTELILLMMSSKTARNM